jgi:hypothetical protein
MRKKRYGVVAAGVALLALALAAPAPANQSIDKQPLAHIAKKKCKKKHGKKKCKKGPAPAPAAPAAPLALTESEVRNSVSQAAYSSCLPDPACYDYGIYVNYTGSIACDVKTTYQWRCYGWNDEYDYYYGFYTCDFREIVDRVGYNGITSRQDTTFGYSGWDCY